jgi:hypothetical protein
MNNDVRNKILSAFGPEGQYSHVLPYRQSGYVDGLFHLSMLAGAARIVCDPQVFNKAEFWIRTLLEFGPDARNWWPSLYAGVIECTERNAQSFAGPCALAWARKHDANVPTLWPDIAHDARWLEMLSPAIFWLPWFEQHINSAMLACLLTGEKPWCPASLLDWNPFYSYIADKKCGLQEIGSIHKPWGSAWLWKQVGIFPLFSHTSSEPFDLSFEYTPVALYVAEALQQTLEI